MIPQPSPTPHTPTPHTQVPKDGWFDGPNVCAFMQAGHVAAFIVTRSGDAYDCTRSCEASCSPLWIGRQVTVGGEVIGSNTKKMVEEYFTRNGNGAA